MKRTLFFLCFLTHSLFSSDDIQGYWKTVNEEGLAQTIIAIYQYEGLCYGRIMAIFNKDGSIEESIYHPIQRAPGVIGQPYYCGLDIIWFLQQMGPKFKGKILDPQKGDIYASEVWIDKGDLIVRGKLLFFGRSQRWFALNAKDIPANFTLPDLNTLVPSIPVPK
jgi:uncharacterized protein (DUF2147 family)